jgi:amidohydrolase
VFYKSLIFVFGMEDFICFRHHLHSIAELSGKEVKTSQFIFNYLQSLNPDFLKVVADNGAIAVFKGNIHGVSAAFRADIDALPIQEINDLHYSSTNPGISHKCGHDGHATILAAFAKFISENRPSSGNVTLIFQPAEETGQGAADIIQSTEFNALNPEYIFGMHNLPGFPKNNVIIRDNYFACASHGMIIKLKGVASHASEPEKGISPAHLLSELLAEVPSLQNCDTSNPNYSLCTITHVNMGTYAFGLSPADAVVLVTIRAYSNHILEEVTLKLKDMVRGKAIQMGIEYSFEIVEKFPPTINNEEANIIVKRAAHIARLGVIEATEPFKWSEDFGNYSLNLSSKHGDSTVKASFFGLGAGENTPNLHNSEYDFPDDIIDSGVELLKHIYKSLFEIED